MSMPASLEPKESPAQLAHNDTLRAIMAWLADRFAESRDADTSIDWEDGEEHDEDNPSPSR